MLRNRLKLPSLVLLAGSYFTSSPLTAAKFQMLKAGEWNVEIVESSLGPLGSAIKTKPFCIDEKTVQEGWEKRAQQEISKAGLDCALKPLKDEETMATYEADCKAAADKKPNNALITPETKFKGQVAVTRVSENEYLMDQQAVASGLNMPQMNLSKLSPEQRALLESTLGLKADGGLKISMKQKYTFLKAVCEGKK